MSLIPHLMLPSSRSLALSLSLCGLAFCAPQPFVHAQPLKPLVLDYGPAPSTYQEWMKPYQERILGPDPQPKVTLTVVTGQTNRGPGSLSFRARSVHSNGDGYNFVDRGVIFGEESSPLLSASDLKRLNEALTHLPDDGGQLPPLERRLVVQMPQGDRILARVYDRARLPEPVAELVRASGVGQPGWVKSFQPTAQWSSDKQDPYSTGSTFAASPDGRILVSVDVKEGLKIWDAQTHALIKAVPCPHPESDSVKEICFSPDGSLAVLAGEWSKVTVVDTTTWQSVHQIDIRAIGGPVCKLSSPQITPDGRHLLLRYQEIDNTPQHAVTPMPVRIYNTKTWARETALPEMPMGALAYNTSSKTTRAVYLSDDKALRLWDARQKRDIATLDENVDLLQVAFSPDKSLVAVTTTQLEKPYQYRTRLRVWDTVSGQLKSELTPYEQWDCASIKDVVWSSDNRHIFATTLSASSWAVQVWDLRTGRHQAELPANTRVPMSLAMQPDGQLLAYCQEGAFRVWNTKTLLPQIDSFIKSLSPPA